MVAKDDTHWEDFPGTAISIMVDHRLNAKGQRRQTYSQILRNPHGFEMLTRARGSWCYTGTYAVVAHEKLPADSFKALPEKVCDVSISIPL